MTTAHIPIVDEHADFYVVAKPADIDIHCSAGSPGVMALLKAQQHTDQLFPVHRLDKATSGLLLVARSQQGARDLSLAFQNRAIGKYYVALSGDKPRKKQGIIKGDMVKARNGCWRLSRRSKNPAVTQFFSFGDIVDGKRAFVLRPHTGKTHQLRVAMKSMGAPILGDNRYGGEASDRLYLHAFSVKFDYDGQPFQYSLAPEYGSLFCHDQWRHWLQNMTDINALPWPNLPSATQAQAAHAKPCKQTPS